MRLILVLIWAAVLAAAPAGAQVSQGSREPSIAPAGAWVERLAIADPNPSLRDRPIQALLIATQTLFAADHHDHHNEFAFLIQNSQGLQGLGNITLPWQPEQSELIIHKVHIIRNGTVIDLLAAGQRFTVARRESNLDAARLDGVLTAIMQAEGLAVGDILDVAFTIRRRAGALPLRGENMFALPYGAQIRRFYARQIWPAGMPMRWRATGALERRPRTRTTALGTELVLDLADAEGTPPPAQAPARFIFPSVLQLTQYGNWGEISAVLAPHYERAAELAAASPLKERIARIAAASPDPRVRAMAALRLVQDEIRYFALVMGDGNYLPATADETWVRRYGDCKGKTVTLMALLHGLGIEAEPVLVNSAFGDGLEQRLPQLSLFDHVIIRARIDGRSYWLDGTRTGDRQLDELTSSRLGWGLPLRAAGAELERLPFAPQSLPTIETHLTYDASRGLLGSIPVTGEIVFRRDEATSMRNLLVQGDEALRRFAREYAASASGAEGVEVDPRYDEATGAMTIRFTGTRRMDWSNGSTSQTITFRFRNDAIFWEPRFTRDDGPSRDAPFQISLSDQQLTETVILPRGGAGFNMVGQNIDRTVAGARISRTLTLENGRAIARSSIRQMQSEISAAEATASAPALTQIRGDIAQIRGPATSLTQGDRRALANRETQEPTTARDYVDRGLSRMRANQLDGAASDFDRAAALNPQWSRPLSNRAIAEINRRKYEEAEALLARAAALDPNDFVIYQGRGLIDAARNRPVQAIVAFTRSIELEPNNNFNLTHRSAAFQQLGEFDDALADLAAILAREPGHVEALNSKARIHAFRGETDLAVAAADAIIAVDPRDPVRVHNRAQILERAGRAEAAAAGYAQALALLDARIASASNPAEAQAFGEIRANMLADSGQTALSIQAMDAQIRRRPGNAVLLNTRCWTRATANIELPQALADCEQAVARAPDNAGIIDSLAFVKLRMGQYDGAIADATAALARNPLLAASLWVRGIARLRKGERDAGEQDLRAARRLNFDIEAQYRSYGVTP